MSGAAPTPPPSSEPTRSGSLLGLVRKLMDYGRQLCTSLLERTADLASVTRDFGTKDIAAILRRIACGLERANALEAKIVRDAALLDAGPGRAAAPSLRDSSAAPRPNAPRAEKPDPRLARLPTTEEIAAEVRRRPIGAVIADICRDLGILPCHPLWRELSALIIRHGGNLAALLEDLMQRSFPISGLDPPIASAASPPLPAPAGTGPP
jgi:hypothetical protein